MVWLLGYSVGIVFFFPIIRLTDSPINHFDQTR